VAEKSAGRGVPFCSWSVLAGMFVLGFAKPVVVALDWCSLKSV
jgi:hypothetical protein